MPAHQAGFLDGASHLGHPGALRHAGDCVDGLAVVEATSGRSYGVIDTTARYVVPAMYKQMDDVREGLRAVQALDGTWAYLDSAGQTVIPRKFTDADKGNERLPDRVGAPGIS